MSNEDFRAETEDKSEIPDPDIPGLIDDTISIIDSSGRNFKREREELEDLKTKFCAGCFNLSVLGQFKRGKSTLLNAVLGEKILPDSVIPLTAVPTIIQKGPKRTLKVHYLNSDKTDEFKTESLNEIREILNQYVTEKENPGNLKDVDYVTLTHPAEILKEITLIDTPGIGSTNIHNTDMTISFLPKCDAALFILSADPPITETELEFLKQIQTKVEKIIFVLNKTDYLSSDDIHTSISFLKQVLKENGFYGDELIILPLSAKNGLNAAVTGNEEMLENSGVSLVLEEIKKLAGKEKDRLLKKAVMRKFSVIIDKLLLAILLERRSLEMPLKDLEEKIGIFKDNAEELIKWRQYTGDLLVGDKKRIIGSLEDDCEALRKEATEKLMKSAVSELENNTNLDISNLQNTLNTEIPVYFDEALCRITGEYNELITTSLSEYHNRSLDMINSTRVLAAELFEIPAPASAGRDLLEIKYEPYWTSRISWGGISGIVTQSTIKKFMPDTYLKKKIRAEIERTISSLVIHNVENLRWATLQNISTSFRKFSNRLDEEIESAIDDTKGASEAALKKRQEKSEDIAGLIVRLDGTIASLKKISYGINRS
ncbi:MAG: dynamin family protein [Methanomicrobiaceae archaeon]|nr:dynamin family protein [Methanomicrobiaceae archaeon]